jgi:hypothetical protein
MNMIQSPTTKKATTSPDGLAPMTFPWLLHILLDDAEIKGFSHVVSWMEGGTMFKVHKTKEFTDRIMPCYFNQTRYKSFQRQLNSYRFHRFIAGKNKGICFHELFMRDKPYLCTHINRVRVNRLRPGAAQQQQQTLLLGDLAPPSPNDPPRLSRTESSIEDVRESVLRMFNMSTEEVDPLECPSATMFSDDEEEDTLQLGRRTSSATSTSTTSSTTPAPQQENLGEREFHDEEINSLFLSLFDDEPHRPETNSNAMVAHHEYVQQFPGSMNKNAGSNYSFSGDWNGNNNKNRNHDLVDFNGRSSWHFNESDNFQREEVELVC